MSSVRAPRRQKKPRESTRLWKELAKRYPKNDHGGLAGLSQKEWEAHRRFSQLEDYIRLAEIRIERWKYEQDILRKIIVIK